MYFDMKDNWDDAFQTGDVTAVKVFLAQGLNVNMKFSAHSHTPLMSAVSGNQLEVVKILLARNDLDIADTDQDSDNCLHWACSNDQADSVALLGQDMRMTSKIINKKNVSGDSALMIAVEKGSLSCVEELVKLDGVDLETKNKTGVRLEDLARGSNKVSILQCLEKGKLRVSAIAPINSRAKKLKEAAKDIQDLDDNLEAEKKALATQQLTEIFKLNEKQEEAEGMFDLKQATDLEEYTKKLEEVKLKFSKNLGQERNVLDERHKRENSEQNEDYIVNMKRVEDNINTIVTPPAPECPICLELMLPPTKVAQCSICMKPVMGRATAMEQMLRTLYNRE